MFKCIAHLLFFDISSLSSYEHCPLYWHRPMTTFCNNFSKILSSNFVFIFLTYVFLFRSVDEECNIRCLYGVFACLSSILCRFFYYQNWDKVQVSIFLVLTVVNITESYEDVWSTGICYKVLCSCSNFPNERTPNQAGNYKIRGD